MCMCISGGRSLRGEQWGGRLLLRMGRIRWRRRRRDERVCFARVLVCFQSVELVEDFLVVRRWQKFMVCMDTQGPSVSSPWLKSVFGEYISTLTIFGCSFELTEHYTYRSMTTSHT